jgi:hypothetical protein
LQPIATVPRRKRGSARRAPSPISLAGFAEFESSLAALASEIDDRPEVRRVLIDAKSRARLGASRCRDECRKAELREMAEWILILLENPSAFPVWSSLRKRSASFAALVAERSGSSVRQTTDAVKEL